MKYRFLTASGSPPVGGCSPQLAFQQPQSIEIAPDPTLAASSDVECQDSTAAGGVPRTPVIVVGCDSA